MMTPNDKVLLQKALVGLKLVKPVAKDTYGSETSKEAWGGEPRSQG